jgi:hypothetical protein
VQTIYSPCDTTSISKTVNIVCCAAANDNQSSRTTICSGDTAQIIASHAGTSYSWSPSNSLSNNSVYNPKAFPSSSTKYIVNILNGNGCQNSDTVFVDVVSKPVAAIEEKKSCEADTISVVPLPAYYSWNTGLINQPLITTQSGVYSALIRNSSGCYLSLSTSFSSIPTTPTVTKNGNQLCADATGVHYQWYRNNVLLPGDTFQCFNMTSSGLYYVEISDKTRNCYGSSTKTNYVFNSIDYNASTLGVTLLPSPNSGNFSLRWNKGDRISASIFNTIGQIVYETILPINTSQLQLNLSDVLVSGEYILWLKSSEGVQKIRFQVQ